MSNPFATPIVPVSGYFVTNGGYALVPGSPGSTLSIVFNPEIEQVWYLEPTSVAIGSEFPARMFHVLRTDTGGLYLGTVTPVPRIGVDYVLSPINATVTADKAAAWLFTLEGEYKDDQFKGKLIGLNNLFKFGVQPPEVQIPGTAGTPVMSPLPEVYQSTWTLTRILTEDKQA